jgi:hypothetical protein
MSLSVGQSERNSERRTTQCRGNSLHDILVKEGRVFVFDKLLQLINEQRMHQPDLQLLDLADALTLEATVSAIEAIERWGIVPEPYEMAKTSSGDLIIRHCPFNAKLPGSYQSKRDVNDAFASLLMGVIQSGDGEFTYRGHSMTLCDPLDAAALPSRPVIERGEEPDVIRIADLSGVT